MSQISLSHQFSRRWSVAPKQVKDALVQELDDIVQLLDDSTALEDFKFAIPDLDDYIETVYHELSQQKTLETLTPTADMIPETTDNQPQQTVKLSSGQLPQQENPCELGTQNDIVAEDTNIAVTSGDTPVNASTDASSDVNTSTGTSSVNTTLVPNTTAENTTDSKPTDLATTSDSTTDSSTAITQAFNDDDNNKEAILSEQTLDTLKTLSKQQINESTQLSSNVPHRAIDDTLLKELEANIDDYLTERLTDISEDLKSWLREQVKQHNQQASGDKK